MSLSVLRRPSRSLGDFSPEGCDLPKGKGAPDVRAHDLTPTRQVAVAGQGGQAVPVSMPSAAPAPLEGDLALGVRGGLAQQHPVFGCHARSSVVRLAWAPESSWNPGR